MHCLFTERDERRVEGDGFDAPDTRPLHGAAFHRGEAFAYFARFPVHGREYRGVEVSLIERRFDPADDRGHDPGKCLEAAHGAHGVRVLCGDSTDLEGQTRSRGQRIAASVHRGRSGMRLLSAEGDGMALDPFGSGDDAERQAGALKHRALLDVQLEIRGNVRLLGGCLADTVDLDAARRQCRLKRLPIAVSPNAVDADGVRARKGRGAKERTAKARTLLVRPVDHAERHRQGGVVLDERTRNFERRQHTQAAVEPSAIGY